MIKVKHSKSILQEEKCCYATGIKSQFLVRHHTMNGTANRKKAEEDGLWIWLLPQIHEYIHHTHEGHTLLMEYKKISQAKYEETHSHEEWMKRYKKNYL